MNLKDQFMRYWWQQLTTKDCDPCVHALKYLCDRMELNREQRYWLCWLYANTYNVATAWVLFNEFPDYHLADPLDIEEFESANKSRLPYQKDQKWLRGCLHQTTASYQELVGDSQHDFFAKYDGDFKPLWLAANSVFKVGRYTAWMWLQAIKEVCGVEIEPTDLMLGASSSKMHRSALAKVAGSNELVELNSMGAEILRDMRAQFGGKVGGMSVDYFAMETSLCAFSKLFRVKQGRYLGFYLDRWADDIVKLEKAGWNGIRWQLLWQCRTEILAPVFDRITGVDKSQYDVFLNTGEFTTDYNTQHALNEIWER